MTDIQDHDSNAELESALGHVDVSRRAFLLKLAAGTAAIPVVSSFSMSGMNAAYAQTIGQSGTTTTTRPTTTTSTTTTTTTSPNQIEAF